MRPAVPRRSIVVIGLVVLAALLRLWLGSRYFGWEESDYGNLAMTRGVLESGFRHYDMNHLPMYYALSALVMAAVDDAVLATRAVAMAGGLVTVGGSVLLADRLVGRRAALLVGLMVIVQPELALYAASSLREPVYAAGVVLCLLALSREQLVLAGCWAAFAFLTRMDALLTLGLPLAVHALGRPSRVLRLSQALSPLLAAVLLWAFYCSEVHGTWMFWGHSVAVNVETGAGESSGWVWWLEGLSVVFGLMVQVLPSRIGWLFWLGLVMGLLVTPWGRHGPRRTLGVAVVALFGFWCAIAMAAQHEPGHNLYWKWLHGILPPAMILATAGVLALAEQLERRAGRAAAGLVVGLGVAQAIWAMAVETERQVELSAQLYKPQLELARWIEAEVPADQPLLVDNIPGCWLDRRPHDYTLHSWMDVVERVDDPGDFEVFLRQEEIRYVLWFAEEWTQAPVAAPWLETVRTHKMQSLQLVPLRDEPGYGWIFYRVEALDVGETRTYESVDDWMTACQQAGVRAVAIQRVDEVRPTIVGTEVTIGPSCFADLIGYVDGVVHRVRMPDPPRELKDSLQGRGFQVRERLVNLT